MELKEFLSNKMQQASHIAKAIVKKRTVPVRTILYCAAMIWNAKYRADKMFKQHKKRFYAIYSPQYKRMFILSYDTGVESYRYLYHRGLFDGTLMSPSELKEKCCYFSASKNSSECSKKELLDKIKIFSEYYTLKHQH